MDSGGAGRAVTAQRDGSGTLLITYLAGSVTAITLASAAYLLYLRQQRRSEAVPEGQDPAEFDQSAHTSSPSNVVRGRASRATDYVAITARAHAGSEIHLPAATLNNPSDTVHPQNEHTFAAAPAHASTLSWLLGGLCQLLRLGSASASPHVPVATVAAPGLQATGTTRGRNQTGNLLAPDQGAGRVPALGQAGGRVALDGGDAEAAAAELGEAGEAEDGSEESEGEDEEAPGVAWRELLNDEDDDDLDVPDDFKDPISLTVMLDPVVLCATGQVYEYATLKNWFRTGNRLCPKTNIEVLDVQVVRVPWLKARIHEWLRQHDRLPPPPPDPVERLARLHSSVAAWVHAVRNDTGERRSTALADLYELLRQWEAATVEPPEEGLPPGVEGPAGAAAYAGAMERLHQYVRGAVMDEAIWLLRHGTPYLQGVAASILAYCDSPGEVSWLAATAAVPAVSLCMSQNRYTSQAATRLLYNLARGGQVARRALVGAGAVTALISVLATDRVEYGYCRDRAAATLALLIRDADGRSLLLRYGLPHLVAMVKSGLDRWEQRDAATVLLKLGLPPDDLGGWDLSADELVSYWCCSRAWLEGLVDDPTKGYIATEKQARQAVMQLKAGTLTHAALAGFIADQDADLDLAHPLEEGDDPWAENAHSSEEAVAAWQAVEVNARQQLQATADSTLAERQATEERRRRESMAAGLAAAAAAAAVAVDLAMAGDIVEEDDDGEESEEEVEEGEEEDEEQVEEVDGTAAAMYARRATQEEEEDGEREGDEGRESEVDGVSGEVGKEGGEEDTRQAGSVAGEGDGGVL